MLFDHLSDLGVEKVDIGEDYYWNIIKSQLYDPYNKPSELDLGSLSDDWQELQNVLNGVTGAISYNFTDLAAILKFIGAKIVI